METNHSLFRTTPACGAHHLFPNIYPSLDLKIGKLENNGSNAFPLLQRTPSCNCCSSCTAAYGCTSKSFYRQASPDENNLKVQNTQQNMSFPSKCVLRFLGLEDKTDGANFLCDDSYICFPERQNTSIQNRSQHLSSSIPLSEDKSKEENAECGCPDPMVSIDNGNKGLIVENAGALYRRLDELQKELKVERMKKKKDNMIPLLKSDQVRAESQQGYIVNLPSEQKQREEYNREEEAMPTLLIKFSVLEQKIRSVLEGNDSLKHHIISSGNYKESLDELIQTVKKTQEIIKERLQALDEEGGKRISYLDALRKERIEQLAFTSTNGKEFKDVMNPHIMQPLADNLNKERTDLLIFPSTNSKETKNVNNSYTMQSLATEENRMKEKNELSHSEIKELKKICKIWKENNYAFHLKMLVLSSRQLIAYEILGFIHRYLSKHLVNYILNESGKCRGEERRNYVNLFTKNGPFGSKSLREGTYAELLTFIKSKSRARVEHTEALDEAEKRLVEEAVSAGYQAFEVGDIRMQMSNIPDIPAPDCIKSFHSTNKEFKEEIIRDIKRAVDESQLGVLQNAAKLIELGCYLITHDEWHRIILSE